jgi:hypothetical protein
VRSTCILIDFVQYLGMIGQQDLEEDTIAKRQISEHCAWLEEVGKSFRGIACEEIGGSVRLGTTTSEISFNNRQSEGGRGRIVSPA